ncbi:serine/threonine-protein kinase PCRK1-like [Hibiscus syriacus]|nr:serine/threonine-protein kinase PCRK1-like [Hibiscus syriacus]XP_039068114.1 serine/threonine-protein kinase PCRK1-like [Hibiscus syriacus]
MGYAAPEYTQTGHLTSKIDLRSYGVFLYELIMGRRPLDKSKPKNEQNLLQWVKPYLSDKKFQLILDLRLNGKYQLMSAQRLAVVANRCLVRNPKSSPKMSEVLKIVNQIVEATGFGNPEPPLKDVSTETSRERKRRAIDFRSEKFVWSWTPMLIRTC